MRNPLFIILFFILHSSFANAQTMEGEISRNFATIQKMGVEVWSKKMKEVKSDNKQKQTQQKKSPALSGASYLLD